MNRGLLRNWRHKLLTHNRSTDRCFFRHCNASKAVSSLTPKRNRSGVWGVSLEWAWNARLISWLDGAAEEARGYRKTTLIVWSGGSDAG